MRDGKDAVWMMCDNPECCGKLDPDDQRFLMQIPTPHAAGRGLKSRVDESHRKHREKHGLLLHSVLLLCAAFDDQKIAQARTANCMIICFILSTPACA